MILIMMPLAVALGDRFGLLALQSGALRISAYRDFLPNPVPNPVKIGYLPLRGVGKVSVRESKSISILFIATQSFGFLLQANNNVVNEI